MNATPPPVDLAAEQRRVRRQAAVAVPVCAIILGAAVFWLPRQLELSDEMPDRLAFVLRADLFVAIWVLVAVRLVSRIRFISAEDNAGSAYGPPSPRLAVRAAFLQNTLEQAFIAVVGHLALATVAGEAPMTYVAGAVVLFTVGRVTFLRGYPRGAGGRAFGMVTTALPSLGAYGWVIYDLGARLISNVG